MFKVFQNNTALTAEDLNDVIVEQAVITFADATERDNAIPAPNPGMHCHLLSTKRTYYYDNGWIELLPGIVSGLTARQTLVCTSTTRPAHADGRIIYETDTTFLRVSTAGVWQRIPYGDSGWTNLSPATNWLVGGDGASFRRTGDVVHFQIHMTRPNGTWAAASLLTTFPASARPGRTVWFPATAFNGAFIPEVKITADGNVVLSTAQSAGGLVVSGSFNAAA